MVEPNEIPEPTELVYLPRPSWAPAIVAAAIALTVVGIYGEGFLFRGWVYSIIGVVVILFALRNAIAAAVRDYYSRPRSQRSRSAVLPAASLRPPGSND
jgi:hypothetical protein